MTRTTRPGERASTTGASTRAAHGAAPEVSGKEHEQLRKEARLVGLDVVALHERRGDGIASHSSSTGRRPEPRKGEEAEGRPLRGEDDGPRPGGAATGRDDGLSAPFPVGVPPRAFLPPAFPWCPALARRGGVRGARSTATKERAPQLLERQDAEAVPAPSDAAAVGRRDAWRDARPRRRRARGPQGARASSRAKVTRTAGDAAGATASGVSRPW